jgi:hypothetical protein
MRIRRHETALIAVIMVLAMLNIASADSPAIGIDANPDGNTATSLGPRDECVSVSSGDTMQVDIFVDDVTDLLAWEAYFKYDPAVLEVSDRDLQFFQAANQGSELTDLSEDTPDTDGLYLLQAVDTADPPAPDSGSGVLARLTLTAVGPGVSAVSLPQIDLDADGEPDVGPLLRNADAEIIGDETGDTFFDGPNHSAQIAVDEACPDEDDGVDLALIIGPIAGGIGALLLAGFFIWARWRRPKPGAAIDGGVR